MRTIRLTDEVWSEIAKRGRFGETEDDVLRRVFNLGSSAQVQGDLPIRSKGTGKRRNYATHRMHAGVHSGELVVSFDGGVERRFTLPDRSDKETIRKVRTEAVKFARENGATDGQQYAVMKALTSSGFHLTK